jgi:hypothetical protein
MKNFYFRVFLDGQGVTFLCVRAKDVKAAEDAVRDYQGVKFWDLILQQDLPVGTTFRSGKAAGVFERNR